LNILPDCGNLISVHLNHLGINDDPLLIDQLTEIFGISSKKEFLADHSGGLYLGITTYLEWYRGPDYKMSVADNFDYMQVIKKALR